MAMSEEVKEMLAQLKKFDIFSTDPKQRQEVNKILEEMSGRVTQSDMDAMREESIRIKSELEARLKRAYELEAENAELKARLEKAVELPCKIGDRIWVIVSNKYVWGRKVGCISMRGNSIIFELYDKTGWKYIESVYLNDYKKTWFTDRTEAEARLREQQGEK